MVAMYQHEMHSIDNFNDQIDKLFPNLYLLLIWYTNIRGKVQTSKIKWNNHHASKLVLKINNILERVKLVDLTFFLLTMSAADVFESASPNFVCIYPFFGG